MNNNPYQRLCDRIANAAKLEEACALLEWDMQCFLPEKGSAGRGEQIALIRKMQHELWTDAETRQLLSQVEAHANLTSAEKRNLEIVRHEFDKKTRVPADLVSKLTQTTNEAYGVWVKCKNSGQFEVFAPYLKKIIELKKEEARCLRSDASKGLYDLMIDVFEPGVTSAFIEETFNRLKSFLVPFVKEQAKKHASHAPDGPTPAVAETKQYALSMQVAEALGYDFKAGRLDKAVHPFSTRIGPNDSRITTKYIEDLWTSSFYGTIHETGHSLYEQGLPLPGYQPIEKACSFGIHESQSLFWENRVGRSREFIEWWFDKIAATVGSHTPKSPEALYRHVNQVRPGYIRIEADEVTYPLHIFVRFELERELIDGSLTVDELPRAWNAKYQSTLGVTPRNASEGVLQDVHWSGGAFGYFPSYALGHLHSAQFTEKMEKEIGPIAGHLRKHDPKPILGWLRTNIHSRGFALPPLELIREVSGQAFSPKPFQDYLTAKFNAMH